MRDSDQQIYSNGETDATVPGVRIMFDASGLDPNWLGWTWITVGWIVAVLVLGLVFAGIVALIKTKGYSSNLPEFQYHVTSPGAEKQRYASGELAKSGSYKRHIA